MIDIEEINLSNSDGTIADSDDDDNAGIYSIDNDDTSGTEDILAEEKNELLAFRTRRTEINKGESAELFLQAREAVVRFVQ